MNIRIKLSLIVFLLVLSLMSVRAQTDAVDSDFVEAVKSYFKAAPSTVGGKKEQLLKILTQLNKTIAPELDDDNSQQYVEEYLSEKYVNDFAEKILAKGMKGLVSTGDLKMLTETMQTPEGKDFQQKLARMDSSMSAAWEDFGKMVVMQLMSGNDPEPIELNSEIPESYRTLFKEYYAKSDLGSLATNMMQGMKSLLNTFGAAGMVDKLTGYFNENLPTLYLNSLYGVMDEGNLRFALKMADMPAYKNVMEASMNMMKNLPQTGITIVHSYVDWLKGKGVKVETE